MQKIDDIILEGQKANKTGAEITADLRAAGYNMTTLGSKNVVSNAYLCMGGGYEPVLVEDGRLVAAGARPTDYVLYNGKPWHTEEGDNETLIPGYPATYGNPKPDWMPEEDPVWAVPWEQELDKYKPRKEMMFRPEYKNKQVRKGQLVYYYDAEGNVSRYSPVSLAEYHKDHDLNLAEEDD